MFLDLVLNQHIEALLEALADDLIFILALVQPCVEVGIYGLDLGPGGCFE